MSDFILKVKYELGTISQQDMEHPPLILIIFLGSIILTLIENPEIFVAALQDFDTAVKEILTELSKTNPDTYNIIRPLYGIVLTIILALKILAKIIALTSLIAKLLFFILLNLLLFTIWALKFIFLTILPGVILFIVWLGKLLLYTLSIIDKGAWWSLCFLLSSIWKIILFIWWALCYLLFIPWNFCLFIFGTLKSILIILCLIFKILGLTLYILYAIPYYLITNICIITFYILCAVWGVLPTISETVNFLTDVWWTLVGINLILQLFMLFCLGLILLTTAKIIYNLVMGFLYCLFLFIYFIFYSLVNHFYLTILLILIFARLLYAYKKYRKMKGAKKKKKKKGEGSKESL